MSTEADSETEIPDSITYREVQEIIRTFRGSEWKSMTLEIRGLRISIGKDGPPASVAAAAGPAAPVSTDPAKAPAPRTRADAPCARPAPPSASSADPEGCVAVRSPAVGSFWVAPSPGEAPFVQVGDTVTED